MKIDRTTGEIEFPRVRVLKHQHANEARTFRMEIYGDGETYVTIEVVSVQRKDARAPSSVERARGAKILDRLQGRLYGARRAP